jgi:hypothetical protein
MLVATEKTIRSHWSWSAATQRLAPNVSPLAAAARYIDGTVALRHVLCSTHVTLQCPLVCSSMTHPEGFLKHLQAVDDVCPSGSATSKEISTVAHFSAVIFLQYRRKRNSLVGTTGVSICTSANVHLEPTTKGSRTIQSDKNNMSWNIYQLHDAVLIIVLACLDHTQRRRLRDHGRKQLLPLVLHPKI